MKVSLEEIIEIVTREVIAELLKKGVAIEGSFSGEGNQDRKKKSLEMDLNEFKTPVLTENNLGVVDDDICELIVPEKTIITPGARGIIKRKALTIIYKT